MAANSIITLHYKQNYTLFQTPFFHHKTLISHLKTPKLISLSFSPHRRRRRRNTLRNPNKKRNSFDSYSHSDNSSKLQFILDVEQLKSTTPISIIESKIKEFIENGIDAYNDLRTLVRVESGSNRVIVSCQEKTMWFIGGVLVWSVIGVLVIRVLVKLGLGLGFRGGGFGGEEVVMRRDRSLGGKEVVVAKRSVEGLGGGEKRSVERDWEKAVSRSKDRVKRLPSWWPVYVRRPVVEGDREEYQREAKALIRGPFSLYELIAYLSTYCFVECGFYCSFDLYLKLS